MAAVLTLVAAARQTQTCANCATDQSQRCELWFNFTVQRFEVKKYCICNKVTDLETPYVETYVVGAPAI